MATQYDALTPELSAFVAEQPMFFVATAAADGRVNVSPKGMETLRVMGPNRILWLNLSGSGNETAGHLDQVNRMTLMWCSFAKTPMILRCYGTARTILNGDDGWDAAYAALPDTPGARQIFDVTLDMVQTSCGWAVPQMDLVAPRKILRQWAEAKGDTGIAETWARDNTRTIDGFPAPIPEVS